MSDELGRRGFLKGAAGAIAAAGAAIMVPPMVLENEILQPHLELLKPGTNVLKINPDPIDIMDPNGFEIMMRFDRGIKFQGRFVTRSMSFATSQDYDPVQMRGGEEHFMALPVHGTLDLTLITAPGNEPSWSTWEDSNV